MNILYLLTLCMLCHNRLAADNITGDTYTSELVLDNNMTALVKLQRQGNEDLPLECRKDTCNESKSHDLEKGMLRWPATLVGFRRYVRCPYAYDVIVYAARDCLPLDEQNSTWSANNMSICPYPPFHRLVQEIHKNITELQTDLRLIQRTIQELHRIVTKYPNDRVIVEDVAVVIIILDEFLRQTAFLNYSNLRNDYLGILAISGYLIRIAYGLFYIEEQPGPKYLAAIEEATRRLGEIGGDISDRSGRLHVDIVNVKDLPLRAIETFFSKGNNGNNYSVDINVHLKESGFVVQSLVFQRNFNFDASLWLPKYDKETEGSGDNFEDEYSEVYANDTQSNASLIFENATRNKVPETMATARNDMEVSTTATTNISDVPNEFPTMEASPASSAATQPQQRNPSREREVDYRKSSIGPVVYIGFNNMPNQDQYEGVVITFNMNSSKDLELVDSETVVCGNIGETFLNEEHWEPDRCITEELFGVVTCTCNSTGYFALFYDVTGCLIVIPPAFEIEEEKPLDIGPCTGEPIDKPGAGLAEIMGFSYSFELYVLGHVLRAISLALLLITVLSFIVFRKARRGTSTHILLNLCAALIVLTIILYISEAIAKTKPGCMASNLLRYYLILVSLLWNGAEAINLYLKLVKVFGSDVSKFTTKAAVAAWGIPGLMVIIIIAVDVNSFGGHFVYNSYRHSCSFKCILRKSILHFALLLPMCIIILFNLVIFGMVLRVIIHQSKRSPGGKNWLKRLLGGVSVLVLMGAPWIFGAFGAIDPASNEELGILELVFQVLFVLLVNAQGIFIFVFHCYRNTSMRNEWSSSMSRFTQSTNSDVTGTTHETSNIRNRPPSNDNNQIQKTIL